MRNVQENINFVTLGKWTTNLLIISLFWVFLVLLEIGYSLELKTSKYGLKQQLTSFHSMLSNSWISWSSRETYPPTISCLRLYDLGLTCYGLAITVSCWKIQNLTNFKGYKPTNPQSQYCHGCPDDLHLGQPKVPKLMVPKTKQMPPQLSKWSSSWATRGT